MDETAIAAFRANWGEKSANKQIKNLQVEQLLRDAGATTADGITYVRQYRDKLVVESPGGFPPGVTPENILYRQSPRNKRIAEMFALCGLVERSGQGMDLIYELCVREAKELPDFSGLTAIWTRRAKPMKIDCD